MSSPISQLLSCLVTAAAVAVLPGCQSSEDAAEPVRVDSGVSSIQFPDVAVPEGMKLRDDGSSHSFENGDFRFANYEYYGAIPVPEAASYVVDRMALDGWSLTDRDEKSVERATLQFRRDPHRTRCEIWRDASVTRMRVEYRTSADGS